MVLIPIFLFVASASAALADDIRAPKPGPTALEKYVNHRHTQIVRAHESARFGDSDEWVAVTALVARNEQTHPSEMRGIWIAVSGRDTVDNVYLPLARANALRARLSNLQNTLKQVPDRHPHGWIGTEDCAPSRAQNRIHKLCVAIYRNQETSGLSFSTGPQISLFLADVELAELVDSIDSALVALELPND